MIMSTTEEKQNSAVSAKSVEEVVDFLRSSGLPIRSMTAIHNVIAGVIMGEVGSVDHEQELAAGVSYLVIGLGKLPTEFPQGINFIDD